MLRPWWSDVEWDGYIYTKDQGQIVLVSGLQRRTSEMGKGWGSCFEKFARSDAQNTLPSPGNFERTSVIALISDLTTSFAGAVSEALKVRKVVLWGLLTMSEALHSFQPLRVAHCSRTAEVRWPRSRPRGVGWLCPPIAIIDLDSTKTRPMLIVASLGF